MITTIVPVHELHGRSVKAQLARCLVPAHHAAPGDLLAVCETGVFEEGIPYVNARTFLRRLGSGYDTCRLSDLPPGLQPAASAALGYIDNDWELLEDLADAAPSAFDEEHRDRRFEMIKFAEGIGLLRLSELHGAVTASVLFMEADEDGSAAASSPAETVALMEVFSTIVARRLERPQALVS